MLKKVVELVVRVLTRQWFRIKLAAVTTGSPEVHQKNADFSHPVFRQVLRLCAQTSSSACLNVISRQVVVVGRFLHCLENFTSVNKPLIEPHLLVMFIIHSNLFVHVIK